MDLELQGKVAVVPASSQGLGRAVAIAFAREGAHVVMCSRDQAAIDEAAELAKQAGSGEVLALAADLTKPEDIDRVISAATDRFGGIDVLITNAGGPPAGKFDDFGEDEWNLGYELTLMSTVRLIRGALPSMRSRGGGAIIAMTSSSIKEPIPNLLLSNVYRAGVAALIKSLAEDLADENIRCNTVCPGRINTERINQLDQANAEREGVPIDEIRQRSISRIPMGRLGEPEEFADAVVYLASARASYITGATLQVDGGAIRSLL